MSNDSLIEKIAPAFESLSGYLEALCCDRPVTEQYIHKLKHHYLPSLKDAIAAMEKTTHQHEATPDMLQRVESAIKDVMIKEGWSNPTSLAKAAIAAMGCIQNIDKIEHIDGTYSKNEPLDKVRQVKICLPFQDICELLSYMTLSDNISNARANAQIAYDKMSELRPFLRTTEPVSLAQCSQAIIDLEQRPLRHGPLNSIDYAKAVLDSLKAQGVEVKYVD